MGSVLRNFGRRTRQLRTLRGWSQEELADECGLHRTYIGGVERGERNVSLVNIERIAKALRVGIPSMFMKSTTAAKARKNSR